MIRLSRLRVKQTALFPLLPKPFAPRVSFVGSAVDAATLAQLDVLLVLAPADARKAPAAIDAAWQRLRREGLSPGKLLATPLSNARTTRLIAIECAESSPFALLAAAGRLCARLREGPAARVGLVSLWPAKHHAASIEALIAAVHAHAFEMPRFGASPAKTKPPPALASRLDVFATRPDSLARIEATARGTNLARWLTALPPNLLDAAGYRRLLSALAKRHRLKLQWFDEKKLAREGAGCFLAVAAGNASRDAGIARLTWTPPRARRGTKPRPEVSLVGKGILFDTGGNNLKPHRSMLDMHTDMGGSAVALASLIALAELRSPLHAEAWLAISENRIGPTAYRPQDVLRAANGVTVQVIHTDAEGRLALADTLVLASRARPKLIVDFATLTGTAEYALTTRMSAVFANTDALTERLVRAGQSSGERIWPFPMDADFDSDIESKVADVAQCSLDSAGDHIHAARFLSRFVPSGQPWAHVDLSSAVRKGGLAQVPSDITGFGVRLALALLLDP